MRITILGASGMLGHQLWRFFSASIHETYGIVRHRRDAYQHGGLFENDLLIDLVDANDSEQLYTVLVSLAPDIILNCIGVTKRRAQSGYAADSIRLNALLPHELAAWALDNQAKVINFSTDCVFDGKKGNYTEDDPTSAEDLYGRTKALGEIAGENALTIRSSFIGPELQDGTELFEWFINQQGTVKGFTNAIYSGLTTLELSRIIGIIITRHPDCRGLYHISSEPISKYALLKMILQHMRLPIELVPNGAFECDRSLNSQRFQNEFNYTPPGWAAMVAELTAYMQRKNDDF